MTRYPRPFKYRRVPAAPPSLKLRTYVFEYSPQDVAIGRCPEFESLCLCLFNKPMTYRPCKLLEILSKPDVRKHLGVITYSIQQLPPFGDIRVTFTKRPRISPKLAATFPRLKLPA